MLMMLMDATATLPPVLDDGQMIYVHALMAAIGAGLLLFCAVGVRNWLADIRAAQVRERVLDAQDRSRAVLAERLAYEPTEGPVSLSVYMLREEAAEPDERVADADAEAAIQRPLADVGGR